MAPHLRGPALASKKPLTGSGFVQSRGRIGLDVEVSDPQGVGLDEVTTRLDRITHQGGEELVGADGVVYGDAQHHEMPDGEGYPLALKADDICDGAKILAIVDAFEAVMLKHINRGRNRSVLRAIAEINACDKQFSPKWIEPFNRVIRQTVEAR